MADFGRKSWTDKASESLQPDSTKSTGDKIGETFTDTGDKIARSVQPDDQKSTGQSLADKAGRSKDEHVHGGTGESLLDKTKGALGMDKH